ncbi:HypC/HybG/HupF family hydrogenase formation chaperone [Shewanella sp. GXUN23E]|uniref:HypC/HybG/HupF family hydrogenase formation chaperone n=1 Tax=Shewanella sp. GXUN23E TaxID=3422498 RepID=UPI003D7CB86C
MCIGLPMQIVAVWPGGAQCEGMGIRRQVDTLLIGSQPVGTWVLVFLGSAREVLSATQASQIGEAIQALESAMSGDSSRLDEAQIDICFADLVNREPPKPESLLDLEHRRQTLPKKR